jgi:hypothetical protein
MKKKELTQIERMLCQLCIGILNSLLKRSISIREAEQLLFSPFTNEYLRNNKISKNIINLIHRGCELEDIESLFPDKIDETIRELIEMAYIALDSIPEIDYQQPTWFAYLELNKDKKKLQK